MGIGEQTDDQAGERNRHRIAAALELPPDHATVRLWFRHVGVFSSHCHYRLGGIPVNPVREAFLDFSSLLYGLLAPYFDTTRELDRLLGIAAPSEEDAIALDRLLTRAQQRHHFFGRLENPAWLPLLRDRGYFLNPPNRLIHPDGSWQFVPWSQIRYLEKIAAGCPAEVESILLDVPVENDNPAIWIGLAECALQLPPESAVRVAGHFRRALSTVPPVGVPLASVPLIAHLAHAGEATHGLRLVTALTRLSSTSGDPTQLMDRRRADRHFSYLDHFELQRLLDGGLTPLFEVAPYPTFRMLCQLLDRILTASGADEAPDATSQHWCRRFDDMERRDDCRQLIASTLAAYCRAAPSVDLDLVPRLWRRLGAYPHDVFARLRLVLLHAGWRALQEELDVFVGSSTALSPPFGAAEVAPLLRECFSHASPAARALFLHGLRHGPDIEEVRRQLALSSRSAASSSPEGHESEDFTSHLTHAVRNWQATRLRWFHTALPPDVAAIAESLAIVVDPPSREQIDLDETGVHISQGGWVRRESPLSPDQLQQMPHDEASAFLHAWHPTTHWHEGPSVDGLRDALVSYAEEHTTHAIAVSRRYLSSGGTTNYATALLSGLRRAVENGGAHDPVAMVACASSVLDSVRASIAAGSEGADSSSADQRRVSENSWQVLRATADLLCSLATTNQIPPDRNEECWRCCTTLVAMSLASREPSESDTADPQDWIQAGLNSLAGDVTRLAIELALAGYRQRQSGPTGAHDPPPSPSRDVDEPLTYALSTACAGTGVAHGGAQAIIGMYLPQVELLVPGWAAFQLSDLAGRPARTLDHPLVQAYLTHCPLYSGMFEIGLPIYLRLRDELSERGSRAPALALPREAVGGLLRHLLVAYLRGSMELDSHNSILGTCFDVTPEDLVSHAYWEVFRGWSDTEGDIPAPMVSRLERFWASRVDTLRELQGSARRPEEVEGLLWLLATPSITADTALELGRATLELAAAPEGSRTIVWDAIGRLILHDPDRASELVVKLIADELESGYRVLRVQDAGPHLRVLLRQCTGRFREAVVRSIHAMGQHGLTDFGSLLEPTEAATSESGESADDLGAGPL